MATAGTQTIKWTIAALATHRLTTLVVRDEITRPIREEIWKRFPIESSRIGYLISCPKCTSVWTAALMLALNSRRSSLARFTVGTLAMSECTAWLDVLRDRTEPPSMFD